MQANIELFKINQTESKTTTITPNLDQGNTTQQQNSRKEKFLPGLLFQPDQPSTTEANVYFQNQTVVYDFNWTPIPKKPTFGPSPAPLNYQQNKDSFQADEVASLSHLAKVTLTNHGKLAESLKDKNKTDSIINVQLLPPRLTSVLFHINEKQRSYSHGRFAGMFRQNKIAPIFKIDPTGLDKKKARSLDNFYR